MQPAVCGKHAESRPPLVQVRRRFVLKASHVMTPESKTTHGKRQASAERFRHRFIAGHAVPTPMYRKSLTSAGGRASKYQCFSFSLILLQQIKDRLVVEICIIIMHLFRTHSIRIDNVLLRYPLPEIRLKSIHSHSQKRS